jgi:hypothetical protein
VGACAYLGLEKDDDSLAQAASTRVSLISADYPKDAAFYWIRRELFQSRSVGQNHIGASENSPIVPEPGDAINFSNRGASSSVSPSLSLCIDR